MHFRNFIEISFVLFLFFLFFDIGEYVQAIFVCMRLVNGSYFNGKTESIRYLLGLK